MDKDIYKAFMIEANFDSEGGIDEYEFICMVSHLCNLTTNELGSQMFKMLANKKVSLKVKDLLPFTMMCLKYNAYIEKKEITDK